VTDVLWVLGLVVIFATIVVMLVLSSRGSGDDYE
jgi:hypothetical protein